MPTWEAGGYFSAQTFKFLICLFKNRKEGAGPGTAWRQELGFPRYPLGGSLAEQMESRAPLPTSPQEPGALLWRG